MPEPFSFSNVCSNKGLPATGTSALGIVSVSGLRRVPKPAAKIMAL